VLKKNKIRIGNRRNIAYLAGGVMDLITNNTIPLHKGKENETKSQVKESHNIMHRRYRKQQQSQVQEGREEWKDVQTSDSQLAGLIALRDHKAGLLGNNSVIQHPFCLQQQSQLYHTESQAEWTEQGGRECVNWGSRPCVQTSVRQNEKTIGGDIFETVIIRR
jgi:hypothetical protein